MYSHFSQIKRVSLLLNAPHTDKIALTNGGNSSDNQCGNKSNNQCAPYLRNLFLKVSDCDKKYDLRNTNTDLTLSKPKTKFPLVITIFVSVICFNAPHGNQLYSCLWYALYNRVLCMLCMYVCSFPIFKYLELFK